jgi:hypothetical protein
MMPRQTRESLSAGVAVTPRESSMPPRCFPPTAWSLDASLPIPRVLAGRVPRLPRYYQGTATSCRPSRRTSLPSFGDTTGTRTFRSRRRGVWPTTGLGLVTRYPLPGLLPWRRQDLPSSWGTPILVCPCSPTPAGRCVPDHNGTLAWPPCREIRRRRRQSTFEAQ